MAAAAGQSADSEISININIGILGHVDSGKTSLSRALATCFSTAALDKNPQSKARGITLDLGFSSFLAPAPPHFKAALPQVTQVQVTLVDCPGHASLIRTIIGGAQIIDMMLLVIDVNKGIQTQTAECIVIGEILTDNLVIALNKIDLIPEAQRPQKIEKVTAGLKSAFAQTRFKSPVIIPVSARVGGGDDVAAADITSLGLSDLAEALMRFAVVPSRSSKDPFLFAVDHCFPIKGQGTVMTGTVLRGGIKIGDEVEVPELSMTRRVKSMQKFKQPSQAAMQGDRVGICVTQFDPALLERGFASAPGTLTSMQSFIMPVNLIKYFKLPATSKQKFHFTIGHSTVVGSVLFFAPPAGTPAHAFGAEHLYVEDAVQHLQTAKSGGAAAFAALSLDVAAAPPTLWVIVDLERPVFCPENSICVASKLEVEHAPGCRIAFHGRVHRIIQDPLQRMQLKIHKTKMKQGIVKRVTDAYTLLVRGLCSKTTDISLFVNLSVALRFPAPTTGESAAVAPSPQPPPIMGHIEGTFGTSGLVKCVFRSGHGLEITPAGKRKGKGKGKEEEEEEETGSVSGLPVVTLSFKKYLFEKERRIIQ